MTVSTPFSWLTRIRQIANIPFTPPPPPHNVRSRLKLNTRTPYVPEKPVSEFPIPVKQSDVMRDWLHPVSQ